MIGEWATEKPEFKEECLLITESWVGEWLEYSIWIIEKVDYGQGEYMAWLTGDGEEFGDLKDLQARRYLVLNKPHKTKNK